MRCIAALGLMAAGCFEGPGATYFDVLEAPVICDPHHACRSGWAVGADVTLIGLQAFQAGPQAVPLEDATFTPAGLVEEVSAGANELTVRALAAGTVRVTAAVDGDKRERDFEIVPATIGPIVIKDFPVTPRPSSLAIYAGSEKPVLYTALVDSAGDPVVGHGVEHWAPEASLAEPTTDFDTRRFDKALARVVLFGFTPIEVTNGADSITFVERQLHAAATITLVEESASPVALPDRITVGVHGPRSFRVIPVTSDGLPLLGFAGEATVSFEPAIATAQILSDHVFTVTGVTAGATTMTVTYDGASAAFAIDVIP